MTGGTHFHPPPTTLPSLSPCHLGSPTPGQGHQAWLLHGCAELAISQAPKIFIQAGLRLFFYQQKPQQVRTRCFGGFVHPREQTNQRWLTWQGSHLPKEPKSWPWSQSVHWSKYTSENHIVSPPLYSEIGFMCAQGKVKMLHLVGACLRTPCQHIAGWGSTVYIPIFKDSMTCRRRAFVDTYSVWNC